jgi:hypothetical protein
MKRVLLAAALLAVTSVVAQAQEFTGGARHGSKEITLSGTGTNNNDFDAGSFGVTGSYGYFFTDGLELSLRQTVSWAGANNSDDSWSGATRIAADYHFLPQSRWRPFVGVNVGYIYGDSVNNTATIGPELGLKYFVNDTTFIIAQTEYQVFIDSGDDVSEAFDDGAFQHTIGLGFIF